MTRYGLSLHRENENRLNVQHRKIQLGHTETSVSPWDPLCLYVSLYLILHTLFQPELALVPPPVRLS